MVTRGEGPDPVRLCGLRLRATGRIRRSGKLALKDYGTFMYAQSQFSSPTCPVKIGKDSCNIELSLILSLLFEICVPRILTNLFPRGPCVDPARLLGSRGLFHLPICPLCRHRHRLSKNNQSKYFYLFEIILDHFLVQEFLFCIPNCLRMYPTSFLKIARDIWSSIEECIR